MRISIIGAPGSGKTTQAQLLSKFSNMPVISIGDKLRELVGSKDPRAQEIEEALEKGGLISDEIALSLLWERLSQPDVDRGFILDGMPRTAGEAREMTSRFSLNKVFHLKVSSMVSLERLMRRGRGDDRPDLIRQRMDIYHKEIKAVLQIYKSLGILEEIEASTASIQSISQEIMSNLQ
jgi:adenylate kinase